MGSLSLWHWIFTITILGGLGIALKNALTPNASSHKPDHRNAPPPTLDELHQETKVILKELKKSLGYPEGTGPTSIMLDGQPHIINVGHTERMRNDPLYAAGHRLAGIVLEMTDLECALDEAIARSDVTLARKIKVEMDRREAEADILIEQMKSRKG